VAIRVAKPSIVVTHPGANQSIEITVNVGAVADALTRFEAAIAAAELPSKAMDELLADVNTLKAQLAKPSPSALILREAGNSLRNVTEGIVGGMLTPAIMTAAGPLWSALGVG
jgi:hypothetical protein